MTSTAGLKISRQLTTCMVMQEIVHCGPISRSSIAKQTGLSKQTVGEIARQLEAEGWIRETGRTSGHVGRTAVTYEIIHDAACFIAVDLGGTKVRAATVDLAGNIHTEETERTDPSGGPDVVAQIARLCHAVTVKGRIALPAVKLAVIGVPGIPDRETGRVHLAPNIAGLDQINFQAKLGKAIGIDVIVENDVNLAVQGEHWIGCGSGIDDLVYISLGTGIGAGIMMGGKLLRGADAAAGELGYLPIGSDPFDPESLRVGALERTVAGSGIRKRYKDLTNKTLDVSAIFDAAKSGDVNACRVLDETAQFLARAIAAVSAVVNPGKVILGGSIGLRQVLVDRVRATLPLCYPGSISVERSALGGHATLAGGAAVGLGQLHAILFSEDIARGKITIPQSKDTHFLRVLQ
ncbi:MAG: ROK family transcriptional regulator [Rhodobacteraceae bacterium]|nr:ROK family transcriptional regulator [Paracoccaceae bacterium]